MPDYSTPNNGYIIVLVLLFFTPIVLHYLKKLFEDNKITIKIYAPKQPAYKEKIVRQSPAYTKPVMQKVPAPKNAAPKNVTPDISANDTKPEMVVNKEMMTDKAIIDEAIEALCALKVKKSFATARILFLTTHKKYTESSTLIMDAFKK